MSLCISALLRRCELLMLVDACYDRRIEVYLSLAEMVFEQRTGLLTAAHEGIPWLFLWELNY